MSVLLKSIIIVAAAIFYVSVGGIFLGDAVRHLTQKHYYRFAWNLLFAVFIVFHLLIIIQGGLT